MRIHRLSTALFALVSFALLSGCENTGSTGGGTESADGKVPITTASEEAKQEYLKGRALAENIQLQASLAHFDKAISLDANFALAEFARANSSPTANEFFDHLKKAVSLADKASEGERLLILAGEAGANGDTTKQQENLEKLVAGFPNDERAHFTLGTFYFGQQDFTKAIAEYNKAAEINEKFAPVYNLLGYANRQNGDYAKAEEAFKKYIELIPDNPNPYDSYAELLLKTGKFDESIEQYRKAISLDSKFNNPYFGIAGALMYQAKYDEAAAELQKLTDNAQNDGERQTALFGMVTADVDKGDLAKALADLDKLYEITEKRKDPAAMSGNLQTKGVILVEMGRYDDARAAFEQSLKTVEDSELSQEIKDNAKRQHHYNLATVALGKNDIEGAKIEAGEFQKSAEASKNTAQTRQSHELAGIIALAEKDYDKAVTELEQSSLQNPRNLYRLAQAYDGKGDKAKAHEYSQKAAEFYPLPQLNYSFIRTKAKKMAEDTSA